MKTIFRVKRVTLVANFRFKRTRPDPLNEEFEIFENYDNHLFKIMPIPLP